MSTHAAVATSTDEAYQLAFEAHWNEVFRIALAWTNDWAAAEDLTQDAYLRLWRSRGALDWERPLLPRLLVTTRRLATDRFRALRRRVLTARMAAPASLDEAIRDRWLDVQRSMSRLSPLERTALVLTAIEGATYTDAAGTLGTSAGALRAAVSRAREKLEAE